MWYLYIQLASQGRGQQNDIKFSGSRSLVPSSINIHSCTGQNEMKTGSSTSPKCNNLVKVPRRQVLHVSIFLENLFPQTTGNS